MKSANILFDNEGALFSVFKIRILHSKGQRASSFACAFMRQLFRNALTLQRNTRQPNLAALTVTALVIVGNASSLVTFTILFLI